MASKKELVYKTSGDKIKHYRTLRNLTQKELAELSGISEIAIRKYESGERKAKLKNLYALSEVLNVPPPVLMSDFNELSNTFIHLLLFNIYVDSGFDDDILLESTEKIYEDHASEKLRNEQTPICDENDSPDFIIDVVNNIKKTCKEYLEYCNIQFFLDDMEKLTLSNRTKSFYYSNFLMNVITTNYESLETYPDYRDTLKNNKSTNNKPDTDK